MKPKIDILLATYNGATFLPEQLASLDAQTHTNWRLIFRDDGSSDGSADIVRDWCNDTGRECIEIADHQTNVGPSENFSRLMNASDAPWFACCDQDDVWLPEKLERLLDAGLAAQDGGKQDMPILVHCDLEIVDMNLNALKTSFWKERRNDSALRSAAPGHRSRLLMHGSVTGCAMLANRALLVEGLPVPPEARMHDWWLSLVAAWRGKIVAVNTPLVRYRQHGTNAIGSGQRLKFGWMFWRFLFDNNTALEMTYKVFDAGARQAGAAFEKLGDHMTPRERAFAQRYAQIDRGFWRAGAWMLFPWALASWRRWPLAAYIILKTLGRRKTAKSEAITNKRTIS